MMLRNYLGIINLDEDEKDIRALTARRNIGSIPIGGRYRIIDFPLSNLVNSGVHHVGVFAGKSTRSLSDHLGNGVPWDLDRKIGGLFTIHNPLMGDIYNSDNSVLENNMQLMSKVTEEYVILTSSYMVCNIDLKEVAEFHERNESDITAVYKHVDDADVNFLNCNTFKLDSFGNIESAGRNIGMEIENNICMEIFVMKKSLLCEIINKAANEGRNSRIRDYISANVGCYKVKGYEFRGYLACINSVDSYYKTNMDMLDITVMGTLFNKVRPIYTKTKDSPPARFLGNSKVLHSLIGDGATIKGKIKNSVIFRSAVIEDGAEIEGCVILQNARVEKNVKLTNVIVDKGVTIHQGSDIKCPFNNPLTMVKKSRI